MNFFINLHGGQLLFARIFITLLVLFSFLILLVWLIKSKKLSNKVSTSIIYICVPLLLFGSVMGFGKLIDPFHHGVVKEIFIVQTENDPLIAVWSTRIFSKRFGGADYDQRIKTFALETGEPLGMVEMLHRHSSSDYRIYWSRGHTAWGYCGEGREGNARAQFLDLAAPRIIKTTREVAEPKADYRYGWPKRQDRLHEVGWSFRPVSGSLGKTVAHVNGTVSKESVAFLRPQIIEELSRNTGIKEKIWITHQSAIYGEYYNLLSLVDSNGKELTRINLNQLFKKKQVKEKPVNFNRDIVQVVGTYTETEKTFVFVTCGESLRSDGAGFTLTGLLTDNQTGKILKQIDYIH